MQMLLTCQQLKRSSHLQSGVDLKYEMVACNFPVLSCSQRAVSRVRQEVSPHAELSWHG